MKGLCQFGWALVAFCILGCNNSRPNAGDSSSMHVWDVSGLQSADDGQLAIRYRRCTNRLEKLSFCLSALDCGRLGRKSEIDSLRTVFGEDFHDYGMAEEDGLGKAEVWFTEWAVFPNGANSVRRGWYLALYYRPEDRRVVKYFISNITRTPYMWGFGW